MVYQRIKQRLQSSLATVAHTAYVWYARIWGHAKALWAQHVLPRYRALSPRNQKLTLAASAVLLGGIVFAAFSLLYNPLSPPEKMAVFHAKQLSLLLSDLERMDHNLAADGSNQEVLAQYLDLNTALSDRCYAITTYSPPKDTVEFPKQLLAMSPPSKELCDDVLSVSSYSNEIFTSVQKYTSTPVSVTWILPAADPGSARSRVEELQRRATLALDSLEFVAAKDREVRYAGVPEMQAVLRDTIATLEPLGSAISGNRLDEANQLWRPTLTTVRISQHNLLTHRATYWREYVRVSDLQAAIKSQLQGYCKLVPRSASKPWCTPSLTQGSGLPVK